MDLYNLGLVKYVLVDIVTFSVRRFVVFYVFGLQCHCIVAVHNIFTPLESLPIIVLRNRKKIEAMVREQLTCFLDVTQHYVFFY